MGSVDPLAGVVASLANGRADEIRKLAEAEAEAIRTVAGAEADALTLIREALRSDPALLTYNYIEKLSPAIQVMLVPNDNPLLLPLPELTATTALTNTTTLTDPVPLENGP